MTLKTATPWVGLVVPLMVGCVGNIGGTDRPGKSGGPTSSTDAAQVGSAPMRRLTRTQYNNAVLDLLGDDSKPANAFSPDDKEGLFASNTRAPLTELQFEQYMAAAEQLAATAASHLQGILPCDPVATSEAACAAEFVKAFGRRAYRRPVTDEESQRLLALFQQGQSELGFAHGIELVLTAMLESPSFLYMVDLGGAPEPGAAVAPLTGWELASRLSFFLWSSAPDDELLDAAEAGKLADVEGLRAQAERMLDDDRASATIRSFFKQWLGLGEIGTLEKDPGVFPAFDPALRDAMGEETARFAEYVLREDDARLETLLTASYSMLSGPLYDLYGRPAGAAGWARVEFEPGQRSGLLTQASVLATHAHADQTSPVHRGKFVRESLLCQPLPPPPPTVNNTPPPPSDNATWRERLAQHRADPACAACHDLMDPIGLGFESFDGIGRYRAMENGAAIDASGELIQTDVDGAFIGVVELGTRLAESDAVAACMGKQWFRFALGRSDENEDKGSLEASYAEFAAADHDVRALLVALATTDSFRHRPANP